MFGTLSPSCPAESCRRDPFRGDSRCWPWRSPHESSEAPASRRTEPGTRTAHCSNIFNIIKELNGEGVTILLVEQNARLAMQQAHRTYVIEAGQITLSGNSSALLDDERVLQAYLGS